MEVFINVSTKSVLVMNLVLEDERFFIQLFQEINAIVAVAAKFFTYIFVNFRCLFRDLELKMELRISKRFLSLLLIVYSCAID